MTAPAEAIADWATEQGLFAEVGPLTDGEREVTLSRLVLRPERGLPGEPLAARGAVDDGLGSDVQLVVPEAGVGGLPAPVSEELTFWFDAHGWEPILALPSEGRTRDSLVGIGASNAPPEVELDALDFEDDPVTMAYAELLARYLADEPGDLHRCDCGTWYWWPSE